MTTDSGEIKSMQTAAAYLQQGVAGKILEHILGTANLLGYRLVSLETGTDKIFQPAIQLYKKYGFTECKPFIDYNYDPFSQLFSITLDQPNQPVAHSRWRSL